MKESITRIQSQYNPSRLKLIDQDFLSFEEDLTTDEDLQLLEQAIMKRVRFPTNPHNSILLYVTGLTDQFDTKQARAHTRGGSPPDCI